MGWGGRMGDWVGDGMLAEGGGFKVKVVQFSVFFSRKK